MIKRFVDAGDDALHLMSPISIKVLTSFRVVRWSISVTQVWQAFAMSRGEERGRGNNRHRRMVR